MKTELNWSFGNDKLKKTKTVSFNLPAFKSADGFTVCPKAGVCASLCYARQGRIVNMPDAVRTREENLALVRRDLAEFERKAIADLTRITNVSIRIHDSGDFFSQAYLDSWFRVMSHFPAKQFYAYTKSLHLDWSGAPSNFQRIQSAGGQMDASIDRTQSHSRIFATHQDRIDAGYVDGTQTDAAAQNGETFVGLVYHGTFKLKAGQAIALREVTVGGQRNRSFVAAAKARKAGVA